MGLKDFHPTMTSVICSHHFDDQCFDKTGSVMSLKTGSVPTKFENPFNCCVVCKRKRSYRYSTKLSFFKLVTCKLALICLINCINQFFTFSSFPNDKPQLLRKWSIKMGKDENWKPQIGSLLCSDHFEKSCIVHSKKSSFLRENSVPTIFDDAEEISLQGMHTTLNLTHFSFRMKLYKTNIVILHL